MKLFLVTCQVLSSALDAGSSTSLDELGRSFRRLRSLPGHFGGSTPNEAVDNWNGAKHQVMQQLAELLGDGRHRRGQVTTVMGEPDATSRPGDERHLSFSLPPDHTVLIYDWRGEHDFLYFELVDDQVVSSRWWMAGE